MSPAVIKIFLNSLLMTSVNTCLLSAYQWMVTGSCNNVR